MIDDIQKLHREWISTELENPLRILDFCTEEIEFHTNDNKVIKGKDDVEIWIKNAYRDSKLANIEILDVQISVLGKLASLVAKFKTTVMTSENVSNVYSGKHFWALKYSNNQWWVDRITWEVEE